MVQAPWRNRIVGSGEEDPTQLLANPANWRTHPAAQRMALRGALSTVGWVQQVLVNRTSGHVVDGHARVEEAISRGEPTVPVLYVELDPEEESLVLATLDPIGAMAERDSGKLSELLSGVAVTDDGLRALIGDLYPTTPKVGLTDPDEVPEEADASGIQPGDLFALGDHRLLCGDATDAVAVERLLAGAQPGLMVTDPPYGVDYDPQWRNKALGERTRRLGRVRGDTRADWREVWASSPAEVAYVWHGGLFADVVASGLRAAKYDLRAQIIWAKPQLVIGRGHYHWQHEPCWYAVRSSGTSEWIGDRKQTTVWQIDHILKRHSATATDAWTEHGTQKPVECMERPLRNHAANVYDPFLGSGTTLIAAERVGRRCYAMEIDPRYVAVAIARWENFTGRRAEKIDG